MKRIILVLTLILCVFLTGCEKVVEEETFEVTAVVTDKNYKSSYTTFIPMRVGKVTTLNPIVHPEKFNITITYEDISVTIDDETLYNQLYEGDEIKMILYLGYNGKHELVKSVLLFPD